MSDTGLVDTQRIDRNLQVLNGVEQTWGLPGLPDPVKLDLASQDGIDHHALGQFATGLAADVHEATRPQPVALPLQLISATQPLDQAAPDYTLHQQLSRYAAGIEGNKTPVELAADGVAQFKERAMRLGYLDPATTSRDGSWGPDMNAVRWRMSQDDYARRTAGNRPGATTLAHVGKFVGDWLAPSGLLKAATTLDLLPNVSAGVKHGGGMFSALAHFVTHGDLSSLGGVLTNGAKAINDLFVPVLNDALLFTGVGEVWTFARGVEVTAEAADGLYTGTRFARVGQLIKAGNVADDAERFAEASKLSQYVGKAGAPGEWAAGHMQAWRELKGVGIAKKSVQAGMRLGLASKLEDKFLPADSGGLGLDDIHAGQTSIADYANQVVTNPLVSTLADVLFTPPNLLEPGSIKAATSAAGAAGSKALDIVGPLLPGPLKLAPVALDHELSAAFHAGLMASLRNADPERAAAVDQLVKEKGSVPAALATHFFGGDTPEHLQDLGAAMHYVTTAAGLDGIAAAKADLGLSRTLDADKWQQRVATLRNKHIAQIRQWDPDNVDGILADRARIIADGNGSTVARQYRKTNALIQREADAGSTHTLDKIMAEVAAHNEKAVGFYKEALQHGVKPGVIESYFPQVLDTFGSWPDFAAAMSDVKLANDAGTMNDLSYIPATSERGRRLNMLPAEMADAKAMPATNASLQTVPAGIGLHDRMFERDDYVPFITHGLYDVLARAISLGVGGFTAAREDTVVKQEALRFANSIKFRLKAMRDLNSVELSRSDSGRQFFAHLDEVASANPGLGGVGIHQLDNQVVADILSQHPGLDEDKMKSLVNVMRYGGHGDLAALRKGLVSDITGFDKSPVWSDRYGIETQTMTNKGLQPVSIEDKVKALVKKSQWMAAEVDLPPSLQHVADSLGGRGYKLVHGVQYLLPSDLLWTKPMEDLTAAHLHRITLGNWFSPQDIAGLSTHVTQTQKFRLQERLSAVPAALRGGLQVGDVGSADLDTVMASARNILGQAQDAARENLAQAHGIPSKIMARASASTTPISVGDLGRAYNRDRLVGGLRKIGYTDEVAAATWQALKDAQRSTFQNKGLVSLEDHLRSQPVLTQGLHLLGRSAFSDGFHGLKATAATTAAGAVVGGLYGGGLKGAEQGAIAGAVAGAVPLPGAEKLAQRWEHSDWLKYAYLPDYLAHARDQVRFGINPFFDAQRMVKSTILAHTAEMGADVNLPMKLGAKGYISEFGADAWERNLSEFTHAMRGHFDVEALDDTSHYFTQTGILGYNPTDWMASTYGRLRAAGVESEQAANSVKKVFTYGTTGRSAAEMSANFVFFPFSFEKKVVTALGRYATSDLSRAVIIHDAMKTYDVLDQHFDLHDKWRRYLPVLNQLASLNPLGHGLSPGQFGGINRPILDLFLPHAVRITDRAESNRWKDYLHRAAPFYGEITGMLNDLGEQGNVLFSPAHMDKQSEATAGFDAAKKLRDGWQGALAEHGVNWRQMMTDPGLQPVQDIYTGQMGKVLEHYPEYAKQRSQIAMQSERNALEQTERLGRVARGNASPDDVAFATFTDHETQLRHALQTQMGVSLPDNADKVPPAVYDAVHQEAVQLARQAPGFVDLYNRFYRRTYGPITKELT